MKLQEIINQRSQGRNLTLNQIIMLILELGLKDDGSEFYSDGEKANLIEELVIDYSMNRMIY